VLRALLLASALTFAAASVGRADTIELEDGRSIEGRVLAAGGRRVLVDGPGGVEFVARTAVRRVVDAQGKQVTLDDQAPNPVAVVKVVEGGVRVQRRDQDLALSVHGAQAVVCDDDVVRTTPYGRVTLVLDGGALLSARSDAVLRFVRGQPVLVEGSLRLEQEPGQASVDLPEGRLVVTDGKATVEHVRGKSRLLCLAGRTILQARDEFTLDLPRNHAVDVKASTEHEPASVSASNANAWPVRLEQGARWVSIQPGERVVLLGRGPSAPATADPELTRRPAAPPSPPEPELPSATPTPAPRLTLPEAPITPAAPGGEVGRVARATSSFAVARAGQPSRRVEPTEATGLALWPGDVVTADEGEVHVETLGDARTASRVRLLAHAQLAVRPAEGGAPLRLDGEAALDVPGRLAVAVPGGELGLLRAKVTLRAGADSTAVVLLEGTAGARFGDDVRAELLAPARLTAVATLCRVRLEVPKDAQGVEASLGTVDARIPAGQSASHGRTGDLQVVELWTGSRLELLGPIRARVVPAANETWALEVEDGSRWPLRTGTYRFARRGQAIETLGTPGGLAAEVLAQAPPPSPPATTEAPAPAPTPTPPAPVTPTPPAPVTPTPPAPVTPTPPAPVAPVPRLIGDEQTVVLANGATLVLRGWGPLVVLRSGTDEVEVEGPAGSSLVLGAGAKASLVRGKTGTCRVELPDGRFVAHEQDAAPFDLALDGQGRLHLTVRESGARTIDVESGCAFDLTLRPGGYLLASVYGQVVYVQPGQRVSVTQQSGLRTWMSRPPQGR